MEMKAAQLTKGRSSSSGLDGDGSQHNTDITWINGESGNELRVAISAFSQSDY